MLVITYTAEHNHPWPIQRNALAGSTRSCSSNPNSSKSSTTTASHNGPQSNTHLPSSASAVKNEQTEEDMELKNVEDDNKVAPYRPEIHDQHQPDDFFADLEELELEGDSLSMLLSQGCAGDLNNETIASDGISDFFGWTAGNNNKDDQ